MLARRLTLFIATWTMLVLAFIGILTFTRLQGLLAQQNQQLAIQALTFFRNRTAAEFQALDAVALELANTPDIQRALVTRNRETLLAASQSVLQTNPLAQQIEIVHYYIPPGLGLIYLDAVSPSATQRSDYTRQAYAATLSRAFQQKRSVQGWALLDKHGLGIVQFQPIYYQGRLVGILQIGKTLNQKTLRNLTAFTNANWQLSIRQDLANAIGFEQRLQADIVPESIVLITLSGQVPVFNDPETYQTVLKTGEIVLEPRLQGNQVYLVLTAPISDINDTIIGTVDIVLNTTRLAEEQFRALLFNVLLGVVVLTLAAFLLGIVIRRTLLPLQEMQRIANRVSEGDYDETFPVGRRNDEIGALGQTLNLMITRIRALIENLDGMVRDRTAALERRASLLQATADVGTIVVGGQELDQALFQITYRISDRFGFYHVGIFMLDERGEYAVLRAANSEGGQRMLARNHKLRVGQVGIVGYVAATGRARIALDVGKDAVFFNNPDLPETRSEMALPIIINRQIIGVLDIQSREPNAFTDEDISVLQTLANQIAIAVENARLYREASEANRTLQQLLEEKTLQTWRTLSQQRTHAGFISLARGGLVDLPEPKLGPEHQKVLETGKPVLSADRRTLFAPISLRNTILGILRLTKQPGLPPWDAEEQNMVSLMIEQLASALENARLYATTQQQAAIDRAVGEISSRLSMAVEIEDILREATLSLGRYLSSSEIAIKTVPPESQDEA
jgi:GAF domain-containing protein